jgi:hypothetical protein
MNIPMIPAVILLGIIGVVAVVGYVILQSGDSSSSDPNAKAQEMERDPAPGLPGDYVNLPKAFAENGTQAGYHLENAPDTADHVQTNVDYSKETSANSSTGYPPAGGPHWGSTACGEDPAQAPAYCGPAPWGIYRAEWPTESVVHNMEHGGVVIWYNTPDTAVRDEIEAEATKYLNKKNYFIVAMPYSKMSADTIALTAWTRRDEFPVSELTSERIDTFFETFNCRFNPESFPACGAM